MNVGVSFTIFFFIWGNIVHTSHLNEPESLFRQLFKLRRTEQLAAVKRIRNLDTEEKQRRIIITVADKIFTMIKRNRNFLESSGFIPGVSDFPADNDEKKEALSNLLENTALISDIILRLPDISHSLFLSHNDWKVLLAWSLQFANETKLLDESTSTLVDLVNQEMNFTVRSEDYVNPYKKSYKSVKNIDESSNISVPGKIKKKTKEKVRGPRMSSRYYGEL